MTTDSRHLSFGSRAAGRAAVHDPWLDYLRRIADGDEASLAAFHDGTRAHVYRVAHRVLGRPADADEVTLDVYLQVWRTAPDYDPRRGTVRAWVTTIARSRALDRLRAIRWREAPAIPWSARVEVRDVGSDPEQQLLARQRRRRVGAALRTLPPSERRPIRLAFVDGCSHRDVAASLQVPLGTIKTRIRGGLRRLSPMLAGAV